MFGEADVGAALKPARTCPVGPLFPYRTPFALTLRPSSAALFLLFLLAGCDVANVEREQSTFDVIQTEVFDKNCTSCHVSGSSFATQSGLVLTSDVSYRQLIDVPPANSAARKDGFVRVSSRGLEGLHKSLLWEKINAPNREHFLNDHPEYGSMMPLGAPPLTNGQIELIRRWILAGAPRDSVLLDAVLLLRDESRYEPVTEFEPLTDPVDGLAIRLGPFEVPKEFEREIFYFQPLNHTEDLFVDRFEISMRPGSHHFLLYTFDDGTPPSAMPRERVYRDLRRLDGSLDYSHLETMQYHVFFGGTQWPRMNYEFPDGVALRLAAGQGLDLNSHYVNRTAETSSGEVHANLYTIPEDEVRHVAEQLVLNNMNILLPPLKSTTIERTFVFSKRHHIFMLMSHGHKHMQDFRAYAVGGPRDGDLVYVSYDWEHPPILELDPPLVLERGEGIRIQATFNNWTSRTLTFGLESEDEMMILFGYFYTE